jgi:hypothetical protein
MNRFDLNKQRSLEVKNERPLVPSMDDPQQECSDLNFELIDPPEQDLWRRSGGPCRHPVRSALRRQYPRRLGELRANHIRHRTLGSAFIVEDPGELGKELGLSHGKLTEFL